MNNHIFSHSTILSYALAILCCTTLADAQTATNALLQRAIHELGIKNAKNSLLTIKLMDSDVQNFQSDRTYPPFFSAMTSTELWFDPQSNVQRTHSIMVYPGFGPAPNPQMLIASPAATFFVRDTMKVQVSNQTGPDRKLNPWSVLLEWESAEGVKQEKNIVYRDYPRNVLVRTSSGGEERLFLDPKTGFPIKLDYLEKHYLWGQIHVEYVYSNWQNIENGYYPSTSFRLEDGETITSRTAGTLAIVPRDSVKYSLLPGIANKQFDNFPMFLRPLPPDTVRVTGTNAMLLKNRGYTEAAALIDGTIYVFDATQAEQRARLDEELVRKLYPGNYPISVIVTDLAWPHIGGVRYWVSRGATIISHRMSKPFLQKVLDRKWTLEPDALEKNRSQAVFNFIPVDSAHTIANGKLRLFAIDGIGSEGALIAYLPQEKFLWASDYIQDISAPSAYTTEVWKRVKQAGITPELVAAEHLPLTKWSVVDSLSSSGSAPSVPDKQ